VAISIPVAMPICIPVSVSIAGLVSLSEFFGDEMCAEKSSGAQLFIGGRVLEELLLAERD
jgi:hypothetical protein